MLKTALQPRWIAALVFALAVSTTFVLLSQWQFSAAESEPVNDPTATETVRPLTEVFTPGVPLFETEADQMVSFTGSFEPDDTVLVRERLQDGELGYWVVTAFAVSDAPDGAVMPVVRGWVSSPDDVEPIPEGEAAIVGRLLPAEAPVAEPPSSEGTPVLAAVASSELINLWDVPGYAAFVTANTITVNGSAPDMGAMEYVTVGGQPLETPVNWLNIFYALEWIVFAGFSVFLWWRLVADEYNRSLEEDEYEDDYEDEYDDASEPDIEHPSSEVTK